MITLAVDTSSKSCSVCVSVDNKPVAELLLNNKLTHSRTLLQVTRQVLGHAGLAMGDVSRLAVTVGPGSYTGLRIGLSFVKGLAMPQNIPCVGVSTLHALAYNLASRDGRVLSVLDARAGQVYAALFEIQSGIVTRLTPDSACLLSTLETVLKPGTMAVGDGSEMAARFFSHCKLQAAPMEQRYLRASSLAAAAAFLPEVSGDTLVPNYHRKSQAEREREAKSEGSNS